jgi:hypothetical protein
MELIDYARPTMLAENALKELHKAMLRKDYKTAVEMADWCMEEANRAKYSIMVMERKDAGKAPARS